MARKSLLINKNKKPKITAHLDTDITILAKEHFGTYLVVSNTDKNSRNYTNNRLYLHQENDLKFLDTMSLTRSGRKSKERATYYVLTDHPNSVTFIKAFIKPIDRNFPRREGVHLLSGLNILLRILKSFNKLPNHPLNLNLEHQTIIADTILQGEISNGSELMKLRKAWSHIRSNFNNIQVDKLNTLPAEPSIKAQIEALTELEEKNWEDYSDANEVTLEMLFQLDYYTQTELERIMSRAREYRDWMKQLDDINQKGGLFSQANILKTFYDNKCNWKEMRNFYIKMFGEDPVVWITGTKKQKTINKLKHYSKVYPNIKAEKRHQQLLKIAKNGIDISIKDERMFAWWQATIMPDYPFDKTIIDDYKLLASASKEWIANQALRGKFIQADYMERVIPTAYIAHLMLIRLLIDSEANISTIYNLKIHKKDDMSYGMGAHHFRKRLLNAVKGKNNTVPAAYIDHGCFTDKCINFYLDWAKKIYDRSDDKYFLQYASIRGSKKRINHFDSNELGNQNPVSADRKKIEKSKERRFFERCQLYRTNERRIDIGTKDECIKLSKEKVHWIDHREIRAACNYRNYHLLFGEWKRSRVDLGHGQNSENVERENYRKNSWQLEENHQLAVILNDVADHVTGKVVVEELKNFFSQPHCYCKDNTKPDFEGAPILNEDEICIDYHNCLTKCDQSKVFAHYHGPTHLAIKMIAEQEYTNFTKVEDWNKQWGTYLSVADIVLRDIPEIIKETNVFKQTAFERIPFMRIFLMQNKRKIKASA